MEEYVVKLHKEQIYKSPMTNRVLSSCNTTDMGTRALGKMMDSFWLLCTSHPDDGARELFEHRWRECCRPRQWVLARLSNVHTVAVIIRDALVPPCALVSDFEPQATVRSAAAGDAPPALHSPQGLSWAERTGGGIWTDTHFHFCNTSVPIAPSSLVWD